MHLRSLAVFAVQAAAVALPDPDPSQVYGAAARWNQRRAACHDDNVLRNLRDKRFSASASEFCSTYIQSTVTQTAYESTTHQTVTATPVETVAATTIVYTATFTPGIHTTYVWSTIQDPRYNWKRDAPAYPTWLPVTYEPSRVSSACSCFITSPAAPAQQTVSSTGVLTITDTDVLPTVTTTLVSTVTTELFTVPTVTATVGIECGLRGCTTEDWVLMSRNEPKFEDCVSLCKIWGNCVSLQWNAVDSICNLLKDNATVVYNPNTPDNLAACRNFQIYDWQCVIKNRFGL
ncbi:hypothetical protein JDV02_002987 [Purpureocillium takamizusanense]|uniref:Apple domain-containing protein n=1 Tax=Purpureocillium takamizusanense TaxID=2060973 RepID=A0A9Q8QCS6_9HYPO|nr:uncharacterized protein JDV02_002987 [Purpureocillium takamizusanense]UNI16561.1 hypothetical protein JDV02_002987 [Purpureocillium takamizusanense]